MTQQKMPRRKAGRGTLHIVAALFVGSAIMRVGVGVGTATADEITAPVVETLAPITTQMGTDTEALLAALQQRDDRLTARENQLANRMQALTLAEVEITQKLAALTEAEAALSATLALADTAAESDLSRLTVVYENMKPKDAAALFSEMSPDFAAGFLGLMRPEAAALIMTELDPTVAYSFSVVLAGRNANVPTQ